VSDQATNSTQHSALSIQARHFRCEKNNWNKPPTSKQAGPAFPFQRLNADC